MIDPIALQIAIDNCRNERDNARIERDSLQAQLKPTKCSKCTDPKTPIAVFGMCRDCAANEINDLRDELNLIRLEADGAADDSLASDFGGRGLETRPTNTAVRSALTRARISGLERAAEICNTVEYEDAVEYGEKKVVSTCINSIEKELVKLRKRFVNTDQSVCDRVKKEVASWQPWHCEHANECPTLCPCPPTCGCKQGMCKSR